MDQELKAKWVAALRGGEYPQADCALYSTPKRGYCCLGVLGRLKGIPLEKLEGDASSVTPKGWGDLPEKEVDQLIWMNDLSNKSFAEIADYIEANL